MINNGLVNLFEAVFDTIFVTRIHEKLIVHSDLGKAASWKRLTEKFLNSPLPGVEETKVCMMHFPYPFFSSTLMFVLTMGTCNVVLESSDD